MRLERTTTALGAVTAIIAATVAVSAPAEAASRRTVCADNVTVRTVSAANQPIGVLYKGESFDLDRYSPSGAYAVGFAYGGENVTGRIVANTITDANGRCQAPYS